MAGAAKDKKADNKQKALDTALTQIERSFGTGAIMRMGADSRLTAIEAIATGAINLDAAIGIGGMPRGRISEIYGPESSGKTTICLQVIANAQRSGGIAAFIDALQKGEIIVCCYCTAGPTSTWCPGSQLTRR